MYNLEGVTPHNLTALLLLQALTVNQSVYQPNLPHWLRHNAHTIYKIPSLFHALNDTTGLNWSVNVTQPLAQGQHAPILQVPDQSAPTGIWPHMVTKQHIWYLNAGATMDPPPGHVTVHTWDFLLLAKAHTRNSTMNKLQVSWTVCVCHTTCQGWQWTCWWGQITLATVNQAGTKANDSTLLTTDCDTSPATELLN